MDLNISVNLWFLLSLCLLCFLAGRIYGAIRGRRYMRDVRRQQEQEQFGQYERGRRIY